MRELRKTGKMRTFAGTNTPNVMNKLLFLLAAVGCMTVAGCSDDQPNNGKNDSFRLDKSQLTLRPHESATLRAEGAISWVSDNEFVATVHNGVVTAGHVGKAVVSAFNGQAGAKCSVEVVAQWYTYLSPYIDFDSSKTQVKAYEKGIRTLKSETATELIYLGESPNVREVVYTFADNRLKEVSVICPLALADELESFLAERYRLASKNDGDRIAAYEIGENGQALITISLSFYQTTAVRVLYKPVDGTSTESLRP